VKRHVAITATVALLLLGARTTWGEQRSPGLDAARAGWSAGLVGGASTDIGINFASRPIVGAAVDRLFGEHLLLDLTLKLAPRSLGLRMDLAAGAAFQLARGRFSLAAGLSVGTSVIHVASEETDDSVWTATLLLQPGLELGVVILPRLELRANLVTLSLRYNRFWMPSWDPTLTALYRF
jgi:hypothetical protein